MVKVATKTCSNCHVCKPVDLFGKKTKQCKACIAAKRREYYQGNKETFKAKQREYYQNNKEKVAAGQRRWNQNNQEYYRNYNEKNKEKVAAKRREYHQNNKEKVAAGKRRWKKKNKDHLTVYYRNYVRTKRQNDPVYRLRCALRTRMNQAVKAAGLGKKCASSSELLGISYQGLKEWLEAQFTEGMTWENRSDWHVDHRVPCDAFDMTVPEQQRICFWYKNLQPMWAKDNIQKSNTYTEADKQALISAYCNQ